MPAERAHRAAKRYIYAWGGGQCRGQRADARPARRQGRGPGRDDQCGPAGAARLHDHDRGVQRLLRRRREAPRRAVGRRARGGQRRSRRRPARASATASNPLLVSVRSGAKFSMPGMMDTVLNLGLNEETLAGPGRADRQRAVRLGRLPALHPDVRPHRHGRRRREVRSRARRGQGGSRRDPGHRARRRRAARAGRRVQEDRSRVGRSRVPERPATSSSTWRSRPCSPRGSASAPATTATTTTSPTTSARRSTS